MKICIRADGGSEIGMGHVMRTLVLAKKLRKFHKVAYVCKTDEPLSNKYKSGIDFIKKNGFDIIYLNENTLKQDIKQIKADCIITDSYDVDEGYFDICKKYFKISGCLDDENICDYFNVDFLINQNLYAKELGYKANKNTKFMLGTDFIILRSEFRNNVNKIIKKDIKDIMITVGGSDNRNLTEYIINKLKDFKYCLHIVVGPGFKYIENLKKYNNKKTKLYFNANMKNLMEQCDICISSCGSTIYELAVCGIPTIGIVVAENQKMIADKMNNLGVIKYSSIENLDKAICNMVDYNTRSELSNKFKKLVNVNGIDKIIKTIQKIEKEI